MGSLDMSQNQNGISSHFSSKNSSQNVSFELPPRSPPIASLYDAAMAMQRRANAKERGRRAFLSRISRQATNKVSPEGAEGGSHEDDGVRKLSKKS